MNTSVRYIAEELQKRDIHPDAIGLPDGGTLLLFEYAGELRAISGTSPDRTSATAREIADNKLASHAFATKIGILTPATILYESREQALSFLAEHGSVVVKPLDAAHGNGVTVSVSTDKVLLNAISEALKYSTQVLIQKMVLGTDLRVVIIDGKVAAAAERQPASVVGDGIHTLRELIISENAHPLRGEQYEKPLNRIAIDRVIQYLGADRIDTEVPLAGKRVQVMGTANMGAGGRAINRTNDIPKALASEAVRIATYAGLFIGGIDFMYDEATNTWNFIEANSSPSFGLHIAPSEGESVDITNIYLDALLDII